MAERLLYSYTIFTGHSILALEGYSQIPKNIPQEGKDKNTSDSAPKRHGKVMDLPGVITMVLTTTTFMLCFTFLGKGSEGVGLFWTFLLIGVASMVGFFLIEKRSEMPLINLKLAFQRIIRVGNISSLMLGVIRSLIFSTIPTLGQTPEPYGLGMTTLEVGLLQLPQALVFRGSWTDQLGFWPSNMAILDSMSLAQL